MTSWNRHDDAGYVGWSRLHKIVAIILALILALTWWLGRSAGSSWACGSGAASAAAPAAIGAAATAMAPTVTAPKATAPAASSSSSAAATPAPVTTAATPKPETAATAPVTSAPAAAAPAAAAPAATAPVAAATAAAASAATAGAKAATSDLPMARVYFAPGKFDLPTNVDKGTAKVVAYLKANSGAKALVTGFHDPSGDKVHNVNLALNRARAVEAELIKEGVPKNRIVKEQPNETTGTGDAREARRVEVTIRP